MILPLEGGQSATLRDKLLYSQARPVRAAFLEVDANKAAMADLDLVLVQAYVESWHVLDLNGNAVALDQPENAPDEIIQAIALACLDLWRGSASLPKVTSAPSPITRQARRSKRIA